MSALSRLKGAPSPSLTGGHSPPGPRGLPLVGNLLDVAADILGFYTRCAREYGDVVTVRFGGWPTLLLSHPEHFEEVLVKKHQSFGKNRFFWRQVTAIFGHGLLTSEGEFWRQQRRLSAPAFSGRRLDSYGEVMVRLTQQMLDGWVAGQPRDLHADMMGLTLRIAAKTLFDSEVEQDVAAVDHAINTLAAEITSRFSRPFVIPDAVPLPGHIRYRRALRQVETVVSRIVAERRANPGDRGDFLSMLLSARDEHGQPMSDRQIRDEAVTLLLAGHETTALTLSWTFYLLGQHLEIDRPVGAEVQEVLGGRAATVADLPQLRFTEQVVTEAMRLYPPAWTIGREAIEDCTIGGYPVAKGTTIYMSPWVVHRDERFFEDPLQFRPERWSGDLAHRLPRFAYMPFGGGPRICIGNRFAMMEAVLLLATIMQRFRLEWVDERPIEPMPSITLRPTGGVWVRPQARTH